MNFQQAVVTGFKKYVTVSGRAPRSEYWYWWLFVTIISVVCTLIDGPQAPNGKYEGGTFSTLWTLITLLPGIAVAVRRLHDIDKRGWWLLAPIGIALVGVLATPFVVAMLGVVGMTLMSLLALVLFLLVAVIWFIRKGTPGSNRFGPDPLA